MKGGKRKHLISPAATLRSKTLPNIRSQLLLGQCHPMNTKRSLFHGGILKPSQDLHISGILIGGMYWIWRYDQDKRIFF